MSTAWEALCCSPQPIKEKCFIGDFKVRLKEVISDLIATLLKLIGGILSCAKTHLQNSYESSLCQFPEELVVRWRR